MVVTKERPPKFLHFGGLFSPSPFGEGWVEALFHHQLLSCFSFTCNDTYQVKSFT